MLQWRNKQSAAVRVYSVSQVNESFSEGGIYAGLKGRAGLSRTRTRTPKGLLREQHSWRGHGEEGAKEESTKAAAEAENTSRADHKAPHGPWQKARLFRTKERKMPETPGVCEQLLRVHACLSVYLGRIKDEKQIIL